MLPGTLLAQENLAFSNDRFSGINAVVVSPAQSFLNPNPWDINLFSADVFLQNDYAYISDQSFISLRNGEIENADPKNNIMGANTANVLDFYNENSAGYHFSSEILGPSFSFKTKIHDGGFRIGLLTRLRTQTSAQRIDNYLRYSDQDLVEPENYSLQPFKINFMNWGELALNISTEIFPSSASQWVVGANFKYEIGLDAFSLTSSSPIELHRTTEEIDGVPQKTISAAAYDLRLAFASSYNFGTEQYELQRRGQGAGVDLGLAVIDRAEDSEDYNFMASLNILDIGQVNFRGENHAFQGNTVTIVNNPNFDNVKFDSPHQYLSLISQEVYGKGAASFRGRDFSVGLPTSIHFNVGKNIGNRQYIHANLIQRVPVFENSLKRSNITSVSYSVQNPVLGYGASVSVYEYRSLQIGGYLRIGPLILGSSNIFPLFFKQKKLHAGDFYIALKIEPFWDNELKRHRRADCYCE